MTTNAKPTSPTPWSVWQTERITGITIVLDGRNKLAARVLEPEQAALIVRAVNAHADLLAALKELVERREQSVRARGIESGPLMDGSDGRYARARAAIAKATGQDPRDA